MNNYEYKGPRPVRKGDTIEAKVKEEWIPFKVLLTLAAQFTAKEPRTRTPARWFFYTDKGVTWRPYSDRTHVQ